MIFYLRVTAKVIQSKPQLQDLNRMLVKTTVFLSKPVKKSISFHRLKRFNQLLKRTRALLKFKRKLDYCHGFRSHQIKEMHLPLRNLGITRKLQAHLLKETVHKQLEKSNQIQRSLFYLILHLHLHLILEMIKILTVLPLVR
jgi:hypothetical protein